MILYHVSPWYTAQSIASRGITLATARGRLQCVWLCGKLALGWALVHVARHHGIDPNSMNVYRVEVERRKVRRVRPGVYVYLGGTIEPETIEPVPTPRVPTKKRARARGVHAQL